MATSKGRPPSWYTRYIARSASHSCITQGWPAALNEKTSTWGIDPVARISRPFARCHHKSGSSGGTAARLKMAVKSSERSATVLVTRRSKAAAAVTVRRVTARSRTSFVRTVPPALHQHPHHKAWQSQHAAPSPRLVGEPVKPFQPVVAHPGWRPTGPPRDEVEGAAHPEPDDRARTLQVAGQPGLLGRGAVGQQ